jgi:hypothetical protein
MTHARNLSNRSTDFVSVKDYGVKCDGTSDDTAAFLSAIQAVAAMGGGTLLLAVGIMRVTTVAYQFAANVSITFQGQGKKASYIQQLSSPTGPVLDFSVAAIPTDVYADFCDFTIIGSAYSKPGLQATGLARCNTWNLGINTCSIGFNAIGTLICNHFQPSWNSCATGYKSRASGSIRCNLVQFYGGEIRGCGTSATGVGWGLDIGDSNGVYLFGIDNESNGTSGNTATGGMVLRSSNGTETGNSNIAVYSGWFENNFGQNISVEAASGLYFGIYNVPLINSESGRALSVGAITSVVLDGVVAAGAVDTVVLAAALSRVNNSVINTLTDTSSFFSYANLSTAAGTVQSQSGTATGGSVTLTGAGINSGKGTVSATTGVATTILTPTLSARGMYLIFAYVDSVGASYVANARIAVEGSTVVRMGGENGANLTITATATAVQVTQSSGVSQTVTYIVQRIA